MIVATIGAAVVGAGASIYSANAAAGAQADAAAAANETQQAQYAQTRADYAPYLEAGKTGLNKLTGRIDDLSAPVNMDQSTLENTPGYQFNLENGLRAVQNGATARGLGVSGAAMKGAASFATGLADNTFQNQFNNATTNKQREFNMLSGLSNIGQASTGNVTNAGQNSANNISSNQIGVGNANAAASIATGNAISGGVNNAINGFYQYNALKNGSGNMLNTGQAFPGF